MRTLQLLIGALGFWTTLRVLWRVARGQWAGEPFKHLPAPENDREIQSRAQIAPAVLVYRALQGLAPDLAYKVTESLVVDEGVRFLRKTLGPLRQADLAALDDVSRKAFVEVRGQRFFNATIRWDRVDSDAVEFTVTSCRFPPLCDAAGVPEIAPMFCAVDERYFGSVEPGVVLERSQTMAGGAPNCPFHLKWRS